LPPLVEFPQPTATRERRPTKTRRRTMTPPKATRTGIAARHCNTFNGEKICDLDYVCGVLTPVPDSLGLLGSSRA
jgi:hypothetical protein